MSRMLSGVRSTRARLVIISLTYRPAPYSRQSRRNAVLVIPAMGARITGTSSVRLPMRSGVLTLRKPEGRAAEAATAIIHQFSQTSRLGIGRKVFAATATRWYCDGSARAGGDDAVADRPDR